MQLAVQTPCQQLWSEMLPDETGRFCDSCQKTVVDFTSMTDQQLVAYFQARNTFMCGRFRNDQLNRNLVGTTSRPAGSAGQRWMSLLAAGLLSWSAAQGQSTDRGVLKMEQTADNSSRETNPVKHSQIADPQDSVQVISGRIIDKGGQAIPGAAVFIKEIQRGVNTDTTGSFSIKLTDYQAEKYVLVVGLIGYVRQEITRKTADSQPITITLAEDTTMSLMGEVAIMGHHLVKKPTLFQKIKKQFR